MLFAEFLEKALNRYLALDPEGYQQASKLKGKTIGFSLDKPGVTFFLHFAKEKIIVLSESEKPDTVISGDIFSFIKLQLQGSDLANITESGITLQGDTELAQSFNEYLQQIDIDWEEYLSKYTGDTVAHEVFNLIGKANQFRKKIVTTLKENLTEYVQEEKQLFPSPCEVEDFYSDIKIIQNDIDRLEARIKRYLGDELCEQS